MYQKELFDRAEAITGSCYALCKAAHLDQSNVSKIKRGLRPLPLDVLMTVCKTCKFQPWEEIYYWVTDQYQELKEDAPPLAHPHESKRQNESSL